MFARIAGVVVVLLMGIAAESRAVAVDYSDYEREIEKEFSFAPGGTLILQNLKGQIEISGWDEDRVEISVLKSVPKDQDPAKARQWLEKVEVKIEKEGEEIRAVTHWDEELPVDVTYWVSVPRRTDIVVNSLKSYVMLENLEGNIEINVVDGSLMLFNLAGNLEASLVNGPMILEGLKGYLSIKTVNGNIQAQVAGLDSVKLCAVNGKIAIKLPLSAAVDLKASTRDGDIQVDPRFNIVCRAGDQTVTGKLNGGGLSVDACSLSGKITIGIL